MADWFIYFAMDFKCELESGIFLFSKRRFGFGGDCSAHAIDRSFSVLFLV